MSAKNEFIKISQRNKNIFFFFLRVTISIGLLWYIFSKIDLEKTKTALRSADPGYIFYAFLAFFFIHVILIWRWWIFIQALNLSVSKWTTVRYFFIGLFGNLFLPTSIGGDILKVLGLCRESSQKAKIVASVLLDRLSGFISIVLVAFISFLYGYRLINDPSVGLLIFALAFFFLLVGIILFNKVFYSFVSGMFRAFPRVENGLIALHEDILLLKNRKNEGWKAVGLSCLSQSIFSFAFFLIAKALHQNIDFIYFLIFIPLMCMAASFPSIGGLGVREAGAAYLFSKVGVDAAIAVSLSLINFLFMIIMGFLGGFIYVITLSSRRVQYSLPNADVSSGEIGG